jgi:putative tricarboxylic transport membrane protein
MAHTRPGTWRWAGDCWMDKSLLRNGDVLSGAVLAALGVYIFLQSRAWDYYTADGPGPGFFPTWYGVAMVGLSLALIASKVLRPKKPQAGIDWSDAGRGLGTWLAFAIAVALMEPLGFLLSFALLTFFLVTVVFRRPPMAAAMTAVGVSLGFYLIFPVALSFPLPTGFLGF